MVHHMLFLLLVLIPLTRSQNNTIPTNTTSTNTIPTNNTTIPVVVYRFAHSFSSGVLANVSNAGSGCSPSDYLQGAFGFVYVDKFGCSYFDMVMSAQIGGSLGVLFWVPDDTFIPGEDSRAPRIGNDEFTITIPFLVVTFEDGQMILNLLNTNNVTLLFLDPNVFIIWNEIYDSVTFWIFQMILIIYCSASIIYFIWKAHRIIDIIGLKLSISQVFLILAISTFTFVLITSFDLASSRGLYYPFTNDLLLFLLPPLAISCHLIISLFWLELITAKLGAKITPWFSEYSWIFVLCSILFVLQALATTAVIDLGGALYKPMASIISGSIMTCFIAFYIVFFFVVGFKMIFFLKKMNSKNSRVKKVSKQTRTIIIHMTATSALLLIFLITTIILTSSPPLGKVIWRFQSCFLLCTVIMTQGISIETKKTTLQKSVHISHQASTNTNSNDNISKGME